MHLETFVFTKLKLFCVCLQVYEGNEEDRINATCLPPGMHDSCQVGDFPHQERSLTVQKDLLFMLK